MRGSEGDVHVRGSEGDVRGSEGDVSATVQDVPAVSHWQTLSSSPSPGSYHT